MLTRMKPLLTRAQVTSSSHELQFVLHGRFSGAIEEYLALSDEGE